MFVEQLLPRARERLVTITDDSPLIQVATLLRLGTDLVAVCSPAGVLTGVITKTDVVNQISYCQGASCMTAAAVVMSKEIVLCRREDSLRDVWARMKERGLKNVPIIDEDSRPVGLLHARDILQILLNETEDEAVLLRDYVMGVGYR
jgi:CBS domain-containing protein